MEQSLLTVYFLHFSLFNLFTNIQIEYNAASIIILQKVHYIQERDNKEQTQDENGLLPHNKNNFETLFDSAFNLKLASIENHR